MKIVPRAVIRAAAGRVIACGFDSTQVTPELREILREVRPAGLVLFARNVESPEQVAELCRELKSLRADEPLLLCVDQEGGRVARIKAPATEWPTLRTLGRIGDAKLAERFGVALGREVRAMGFDVDFAPVLDVDTNPDNPVIGDRSLERDPDRVATLGAAICRGLQAAGVAACGKHFPGHGDTNTDSHLELPTLEHELDRLRAIEWPPFKAAIDAGVSSIMTAHVMVPVIDEIHPGTLSAKVLDHLRDELAFSGVIVSDDIEMKAVAERYTPMEMASLGLNAGVDLFLACHKPEVILELYRGVVQAVERDEISHTTLLAAEKRVQAWRQRFCRPKVDEADFERWVGCGEHAALVNEINERATVLV